MKSTIMKDLLQFFYSIIQIKHPHLSNFSLLILSKYIEWIDFDIIMSKEYLTLFYALMNVKTFRKESCLCLN